MLRRTVAATILTVTATAPIASADTITLAPVADATLYQDSFGEPSNGAGTNVFSGVTRDGNRRRALLRFDLGSIPAGSTINSVSLKLTCTRQITGEPTLTLHRVTNSWGEGIADAGEPGGAGTAANTGDATWSARFFGSQAWTNPGGDFSTTVSAAQIVSTLGEYVWTDTQMATDVQAWLDAPETNHGWILIGSEAETFNAKRFGSRENLDAAARPVLTVVFTAPPSSCPGDADGSGAVNFSDITSVLANLGAIYPTTGPGDANADGAVNFSDITEVLANLGSACA